MEPLSQTGAAAMPLMLGQAELAGPDATVAQQRRGGASMLRSALAETAIDSPATVAANTDMDAIRHEGLTGRQLRMARRVAL